MASGSQSWRDKLYLAFFCMHMFGMLSMDLVPFLYPASLYQPKGSPLHFLSILRTWYISTYNDPFIGTAHADQPSWFRLYTYFELFYQLPGVAWAIYSLASRPSGRTSGATELWCLVLAFQIAFTTATCFYDVSFWDPAVYSPALKNMFRFGLFGPWLVIPGAMFVDMYLRILARVQSVPGTKKMQ